MQFIPLSFLAGILTILSPCVVPILPVLLGGSATNTRNLLKPAVIVGALSVSIVVFTGILRSTAEFVGVVNSPLLPIASGVILCIFGLFQLFPHTWEVAMVKLNISKGSGAVLQKGGLRNDLIGDIMIGLALGPIFLACSPALAIVIIPLINTSVFVGLLNLVVYTIGFSIILLPIAYISQLSIHSLKWAVNPDGWFKRLLGILFILLGVGIILGYDKRLETMFVNSGVYGRFSTFEEGLSLRFDELSTTTIVLSSLGILILILATYLIIRQIMVKLQKGRPTGQALSRKSGEV